MKLDELSPQALKAAMRSGTEEWGQWGSVAHHVLYIEPIGKTRHWRKCRCGCQKRAAHRAMANGVCMSSGCELAMHRFIRKFA